MRDTRIDWPDWSLAISERRLRATTFGGACVVAFIYAVDAFTGTSDRVREARERLAQELLRDGVDLRWTAERIGRTLRGLRPLTTDEIDHLLASALPFARLFRHELNAVGGTTPLLRIAEKSPPRSIPGDFPVMVEQSARRRQRPRVGPMPLASALTVPDLVESEARLRAEVISYRDRLLAAEEWAAARRWASVLDSIEAAMRLPAPSPRHGSGTTLYTDAVREVLRDAGAKGLPTDDIFGRASALIKQRAPSAPPLGRQQMARMLNRMSNRTLKGVPSPLVEKVAASQYRWLG